MHTPVRRWVRLSPSARWGAALAAVVALAFGLVACKEELDPEVVGRGLPDTGSTGTPTPEMAQRCKLDEKVDAPEEGTPERVVARVLGAAKAAGDEDDEAEFQRFFGQFAEGQDESWARSQYWKAARKHADLFVYGGGGDEPVTYVICRRQEKDGGVTLYLGSKDTQKKSHVPITLEKQEDGAWKVTKFSP
ncbi:MAG: hypothetical protein ACQEXJ_16540 [Myxococcota bacterium]